jgi:hypothetical protein
MTIRRETRGNASCRCAPRLSRRVRIWLALAGAVLGLLAKLAAIVVPLISAWRAR